MAELQSLRGPTRQHRKSSRGVTLAIAGFAVAIVGTSPTTFRNSVSDALAGVLERRFERMSLADPGKISGLVVLGGGEERLREAGRLARLHPHLKLHVSGAGEPVVVWEALGNGIEPARVSIETVSRNTFENAVNSRRAIAASSDERWLLVTSAMHMPRSMGAFRKSGLGPEPWPVDDRATSTLEAVMREWVALLWYWVSGRSSSLFPGPLK